MSTTTQSTAETIAALTAHTWTPQPEPARLVHRLLNECLQGCSFAATLSQKMLDETGTRMLDWIDHVGLPSGDKLLGELAGVGYVAGEADCAGKRERVWSHPAGMFPRIREIEGAARQLAIKVSSVIDFLCAYRLSTVSVEGEPFSSLRRARIAAEKQVEFWVIERHGNSGFACGSSASGSSNGQDGTHRTAASDAVIAHHAEALRLRHRQFESDAAGFTHANKLIDAAIADVGRDRACDLFFAAEREYWQRRNHAGTVQLHRQEKLGLGWANHDHHTYRSSRDSFAPLIAFLEKLGFECRERFYAGREAGWGAQVIEHHVTGVTIFADVDLSPEELAQDFSHEPLPPRAELGTVGLWCALHGEAFLQAGMHHLECQFDFAATRDQLKRVGIDTMPPFTDYPYLRQAFTKGEQWRVDPVRVERLRSAKKITDQQAEQFLSNGALGSHLEILQRDDGYKGFNQRGINEIIAATDPRRAALTAQ